MTYTFLAVEQRIGHYSKILVGVWVTYELNSTLNIFVANRFVRFRTRPIQEEKVFGCDARTSLFYILKQIHTVFSKTCAKQLEFIVYNR